MRRIFFATDIHGSEICWKKFLNAGKFYSADVLVLGGDMTGKAMIPIVMLPGGKARATLLQQPFELNGEVEIQAMEQRIASRGYYAVRLTPEQLAELEADPEQMAALFKRLMLEAVEKWMGLARERLEGTGRSCLVCPGNDDEPEIDAVIGRSSVVRMAEGAVLELGEGFRMVSTGWTNATPWHTYREESEPALAARLAAMLVDLGEMQQAVFNFHSPPFGSGLDEAPEMDAALNVRNAGRALVPVGSTAVRDAILRYQPLLSLHGHVHEARGTTRLGRTLVINPGSMYEQGVLQGVLIDLDAKKGIRNYTLTTG